MSANFISSSYFFVPAPGVARYFLYEKKQQLFFGFFLYTFYF